MTDFKGAKTMKFHKPLACLAMVTAFLAFTGSRVFAQTVPTYTQGGDGAGKNGIGTACISTGVLGTAQVPAVSNANVAGCTVVGETLVWDGTAWRRQSANTSGVINAHPGDPATWWRYVPPVGGYLNSTAGVTTKAAAGASVSNYIWGGECFAEPLTTATEIELRDGAAGAAMWRIKVPTTGWTNGFDINFATPIRGTANTLIEFAGTTASGAGAIYCNWRGSTGP